MADDAPKPIPAGDPGVAEAIMAGEGSNRDKSVLLVTDSLLGELNRLITDPETDFGLMTALYVARSMVSSILTSIPRDEIRQEMADAVISDLYSAVYGEPIVVKLEKTDEEGIVLRILDAVVESEGVGKGN